MSLRIDMLKNSFQIVESRGNEFASLFFMRLFTMFPETKPLFANTDMRRQKKKFVNILRLIVESLEETDILAAVLRDIGRRCQESKVSEGHCSMAGVALITALSEFLKEKWTLEMKDVWVDTFEEISGQMMEEVTERTRQVA